MTTLTPSLHHTSTYDEPRPIALAWAVALFDLLGSLGRPAKITTALEHMDDHRARDIGLQDYIQCTMTEYPSQRAYDRIW